MTKNDENGDMVVGVIEERIVYLQGRYANTARNHGRFSPDALTLSSRLSEASDILTCVKQALSEERVKPLPAGADLLGLYDAVEHFKKALREAFTDIPEEEVSTVVNSIGGDARPYPPVTLEDIHTVVGEEIRKALVEHRQWETVLDGRAREHHYRNKSDGRCPVPEKINDLEETEIPGATKVENLVEEKDWSTRALYETILDDINEYHAKVSLVVKDGETAHRLGKLRNNIIRRVKELYYITKETEE